MHQTPSIKRIPYTSFAALVFLAAVSGGCEGKSSDSSAALRALTGSRTRVVWVQSFDSSDTYLTRQPHIVMGIDTNDGKGIRRILSKKGNYTKPLITPDGNRIVYSSRAALTMHVVNWDGSGVRYLEKGFALDVWKDPKTGKTWVYYQAGQPDRGPVYRFLLDNPKVKELIWDKKGQQVYQDVFQVSRDGTHAAGLFPWPSGGRATLPNRSWTRLGRGCWPGIAPDNSYITWVFDGPHRNVYMYVPGLLGNWPVDLTTPPGVDRKYEIYHPRWSNHVRILTVTGPYKVGRFQKNSGKIFHGGKPVEVYVGRFDASFARIEKWVRITNNDEADFYPDVWVENGDESTVEAVLAAAGLGHAGPKGFGEDAASVEKPREGGGLVFVWENQAAQNKIVDPSTKAERTCNVRLKGLARFGRLQDAILQGGALVARDVDKLLLDACRSTNQLTIEATITPAHLAETGPARIATFSSGSRSRNFTLGQEKGHLVLRLRTPATGLNAIRPQVTLGTLAANTPHHVIITYSPGRLIYYLNGKRALTSAKITGDFSNWSPQHLLFGDEWDGHRDWAGRIEDVAIYNRTVTPEQAVNLYQLQSERLKARKAVSRIVLQAKVIHMTPAPYPKEIAPYRRALALGKYKVLKVVNGKYDGSEILVAHWVVLDGRRLNSAAARKPGTVLNLTVEMFSDHPQLQGERLVSDIDDFELEQYMDVGPVWP